MIEEWLKARELILPAIELSGGTHTEDDIITGLLVGNVNINSPNAYKLWLSRSGKAALVTEFIQYPRMKYLHWWLAGGDLEEIYAMEKPILEWAKAHGCSRVSLSGRMGWARKLHDYKVSFVTMYKDI